MVRALVGVRLLGGRLLGVIAGHMACGRSRLGVAWALADGGDFATSRNEKPCLAHLRRVFWHETASYGGDLHVCLQGSVRPFDSTQFSVRSYVNGGTGGSVSGGARKRARGCFVCKAESPEGRTGLARIAVRARLKPYVRLLESSIKYCWIGHLQSLPILLGLRIGRSAVGQWRNW